MRSRHVRRMQERAQLVGLDGLPLVAPKGDTEIPFIRHNPAPGVKKGLQTIDRGPKVYAEAIKFIARGGRFVSQITPHGKAQLVAGFPVKGGAKDELAVVAEEFCENNPSAVGHAVDRLVTAAVFGMDAVILGESQAGTLQ